MGAAHSTFDVGPVGGDWSVETFSPHCFSDIQNVEKVGGMDEAAR